MFTRFGKAIMPILGSVALTTAAFAHAQLQTAVPAVGGTVKGSPSRLMLSFTEGVEPRFSSVSLATAGGAAVPLGRITVGGADATVVTVAVAKALKPGIYVVNWRVTSVDSHKTQGSYRFTVEP